MTNVVIEDYKVLEAATDEEKDAMYNYICDRLGFITRRDLCLNEKLKLLREGGYL